ncbi:hypothetical protein ACIBKX_09300 [Streptomyces sp. NPDC050658]|uniref:hypothetical protein n=1 Tax=unclassified Streptomyces TaxID=2593676 RepID=UPI0034258AA6
MIEPGDCPWGKFLASEAKACNTIGDNNRLTCVVERKALRLGTVEVTWPGPEQDYMAVGGVSGLKAPPNVPEEDKAAPCSAPRWDDWISSQSNLYALNPGFFINLTGGAEEVVSVTAVRIQVISRQPLKGTADPVRCWYGAGSGSTAYEIEANTLEGKVHVQKHKADTDYERLPDMPPGSVDLVGQGAAHAKVSSKSKPDHLYSGVIIVEWKKNGKNHKTVIGSKKAPFQWINHERFTDDDTFGWDGGRWQKGYNPFT